MAKKDEDTADTRLARLILALRSQGVSDPAVLNAIETTPRESFTPDLFRPSASRSSSA
jgi:protein-L-isoaspartate(D-aspartate) O-methyltransferase